MFEWSITRSWRKLTRRVLKKAGPYNRKNCCSHLFYKITCKRCSFFNKIEIAVLWIFYNKWMAEFFIHSWMAACTDKIFSLLSNCEESSWKVTALMFKWLLVTLLVNFYFLGFTHTYVELLETLHEIGVKFHWLKNSMQVSLIYQRDTSKNAS